MIYLGGRRKPELTMSEHLAVAALVTGVGQVLCAADDDRMVRLFRSWAKILGLVLPEFTTPSRRSLRHELSNADIHIALQRIEAAGRIYGPSKLGKARAFDAQNRLTRALWAIEDRRL
jgi:hypothetical protein